jgi:guanylate kinase
MSESSSTASRTGLIIVVSAPSGGGKSSLCQRLLNWSPKMVYSVSCTTRAPRGGEQNGHDYFFLTTDEFEKKIAAGEFLEHAKYNGNYYGTPRKFVEEQLDAGRDILLDIEVQGAGQILKSVRGGQAAAFTDSLVTIFLMPPSLELLEKRLRRRGTDSEEVIRKRLALAVQELAHWPEYDYVIVSGKLDADFEQGKAIVIAEKCRTARVSKGEKPWQENELSF